MKFTGTIVETCPNGVTLAVEVRVEAPDGDAARPVADAAMAALEARPLPPSATRRVVPVALVKEEPYGRGENIIILSRNTHRAVSQPNDYTPHPLLPIGAAYGVADDDGMRRDSRE